MLLQSAGIKADNFRAAYLLALFIVLLGVLLRVHFGLFAVVTAPLIRDAGEYYSYAYNLKYKGVYSSDSNKLSDPEYIPKPDAVRSPGYPLFLSTLISPSFTQADELLIISAQIVLSIVTMLGWYLLFAQVLGKWGGVLAAVPMAISPHLITVNSYILSESLFGFMVMIVTWSAVLAHSKQSWRCYLVLGVTLALAALVRPSISYLFLIFTGTLFFVVRRKSVLILPIAFLCILAPWQFRNLQSIGRLSDKTLQVNFLYHGIYPRFQYNSRPETYPLPYRYDEEMQSGVTESKVLKTLIHRASENPLLYLRWYLIEKVYYFWSWAMVQGNNQIYIYPVKNSPYTDSALFLFTKDFSQIIHYPLMVLALFYSLYVWIKPQALPLRVVSVIYLYYTFIHMIGAPFPRYSIPLRPVAYMLAIGAIVALSKRKQANPNS